MTLTREELDKLHGPELMDEMLEWIDDFRENSGQNPLAAGNSLPNEFDVTRKQAREIIVYWMESFEERHA
jgi:hypothetical protein